MKVAELLIEGTWSLPDSHAAVRELMSLLDAPLKWNDKKKLKRIYALMGDDDLFDELGLAQDAKSDDVRPVLVKHLPRLLNTNTWVKKPDEETLFAIGMLKKKLAALKGA